MSSPLPRDLDYDGLTADIGGPVTNVDIPGVTVTPTDLALDTTAANPTATYQVVLDTMPAADVTITPTTSDPAVTVSGPVTFTPDNWDQPQTVTLTAPTGTAPHTAVINLEVTGGDAAYLALDPGDVNVAVGDPATTITLTANPDQPTTTKPTTVTATLTADVGTPTGSRRVPRRRVSPATREPDCDTEIVDGVAHINLGRLPAGTHTITATYPGDATHRPADRHHRAGRHRRHPRTGRRRHHHPRGRRAPPRSTCSPTTPTATASRSTRHTAADQRGRRLRARSVQLHPQPDFHGTDSFTYTVTEGTHTATATVTITVDPVNDPPSPHRRHLHHRRGHRPPRSRWSATTTDVDGDSLTVAGHTQPADGEVVCDDSSCTLHPGS